MVNHSTFSMYYFITTHLTHREDDDNDNILSICLYVLKVGHEFFPHAPYSHSASGSGLFLIKSKKIPIMNKKTKRKLSNYL